ncbi:hypothetical protein V6N13_135355 [Hibiscus sabdariffa]
MKFGKEFASQMVPEWQEAYMDYAYLKTLLKELQRSKHGTKPPAAPGLKRKLTLYRAFSGLTQRRHHVHNPASPSSPDDIKSQPILVNSVDRNGSQSYETTFLKSSEEGGNTSWSTLEGLMMSSIKWTSFIRLKLKRIKVENPHGIHFDRSVEMTRLASDIADSAAVLSASTPSGAISASKKAPHLEAIEESTRGGPDHKDDDNGDEKERNTPIEEAKPTKAKPKVKVIRPAPLAILDRVEMNNTLETPRSTIKGVLQVEKHAELSFSRENLRKVEEQLKRAFVEFYQKLRLLKSYSFLNTLAFSKIMKKYDKITSRNASKPYMKMVDNSFLSSSDEVKFL